MIFGIILAFLAFYDLQYSVNPAYKWRDVPGGLLFSALTFAMSNFVKKIGNIVMRLSRH
jgi:hypothetical protein